MAGASAGLPLGGEESLLRECGYCANGLLLREILPAKKCDYCFKFKCQFCTLRVPLLKSKKGLPKVMKGNSRVCMHCFDQLWLEAGAASASNSEGGASSRRGSSLSRRASLGADARRESLWRDERRSSLGDAALRESLLRDSFNDADQQPLGAIDESGASPSPSGGVAKRLARALGLVIQSDAPKPQDVVHVVDLWMSLFTAATLLAVVLVQDLTLQQRVCFCVVIYGGFLAVHPWIHNVAVRSQPPGTRRRSSGAHVAPPPLTQRAASAPALVTTSVAVVPSRPLPEAYRPTLQQMKESFSKYVSDPTQWKFIKSVGGGKIYEIDTGRPQVLFMLDMFISGISITEFLNYMHRTNLKDRSVWDWNVGAFEVVEDYPDDDTCLVYNAQKAFLGGIVSARDFCILYHKTPNTTIYASVEHPRVPERPGNTRGQVLLAGLNCTPARNDKGEDGFQLQYMAQVDIGGSIPTRLLYSGQVDNMEKMVKAFGQAHKLFRRNK